MKSTISYSKFLAGMGCALALAGCDSIKDLPSETFADLPAVTAVIGGSITGLSSAHAVTLVNNLNPDTGRSFLAPVPVIPNSTTPVHFAMGSFPVGSTYSVTVKLPMPFGKNCVVSNGEGTITAGVPVNNVLVECTNTLPRLNMTVKLPADPAAFTGLTGARVRVTTEEQVYEQPVTSGQTLAVFNEILINATGQANGAPWTVTAVTLEDGKVNKCAVANPANAVSTLVFNPVTFLFDTVITYTNPTANVGSTTSVGTPIVGYAAPGNVNVLNTPACKFPVSGRVGYSQPPGSAYVSSAATDISGLKLQLQDTLKNMIEEVTIPTCNPTTAVVITGTTTTTPAVSPSAATPVNGCTYAFTTPLRSFTTSGLYVVAVSQQPAGMHCLVTNAGTVNIYTTGTTSPVAVTSANVFCRPTPSVNKQLHGVFRLQATTYVPNVNTPVPVVSTWQPFNQLVQNNASSNMLALFSNGSFLYGAHANTTQVEHGFYDYDASNPGDVKLRFTLITDTNTSAVFPTNFAPTLGTTPGATFTTTPGISALPNPIRQDYPPTNATAARFGAFSSHPVMNGVTFATTDDGLGTMVRTITGTFGTEPGGTAAALNITAACSATAPCVLPGTGASTTAGACSTAAPCVMPATTQTVKWELEDPASVNGEMTGAWLQQDARRLWVWDYRTLGGTSVGMLGGSPSMNDACFTIEDLHASSGIITRRGSGLGCYAWNRSRTLPTAQAYTFSGAEAVDFTVPTTTNASLPGYNGRIPGGEPALNPFPVSPILFHVAPAATFFDSADPVYFPENFPLPTSDPTSLSWCTTEILGIRETTNNIPVKDPIYMCRTRAP